MVAGDLVNTASRIQSVGRARHGARRRGDAPRDASRRSSTRTRASHELKGKEGQIPLWRALRVVSGARGALKSEGLEAPFVGRDRELRLIKELFHACAEERQGAARLGHRHRRHRQVAARRGSSTSTSTGSPQIVYWHRGRCLAYGEGVTYWALADMVRMRCRIAEDEEPASALREAAGDARGAPPRRRGARVRRAAARAPARARASTQSRDRQELFAAWRLFFERLADVYPTVLVFEDMQWADAALLDFVEYLLEWSRNHPIYVVTLARPELLERRPTWGAGQRNFTSLYLEPLSERRWRSCSRARARACRTTLRDQILARAEGVPLYAVETVRMLLDRGLLVQEGSVYRPDGDDRVARGAGDAARADRRPPRRALGRGAAAAPGRRGARQDLHARGARRARAVSGGRARAAARVARPQGGARRSRPIRARPSTASTASSRTSCATSPTRRSRSASAGRGTSRRPPTSRRALPDEDEVVEVVASHYLDAYELAPGRRRRGRDQERRRGARSCAPASGRQSLGRDRRGAALLRAGGGARRRPARAGRAPRAGRARWPRRGSRDRRGATTSRASRSALFEAEGDTHAPPASPAGSAEIDYREGHPAEARRAAEAAFERLAGDGARRGRRRRSRRSSGAFLVLNGDSTARQRLEPALELAEACGSPESLAQRARRASRAYSRTGTRLEEAGSCSKGALEIALANDLHGDPRSTTTLASCFQSSIATRTPRATWTRHSRSPAGSATGSGRANFLAGPISALCACSAAGTRRWPLDGRVLGGAASTPRSARPGPDLASRSTATAASSTRQAGCSRFGRLEESTDVQDQG